MGLGVVEVENLVQARCVLESHLLSFDSEVHPDGDVLALSLAVTFRVAVSQMYELLLMSIVRALHLQLEALLELFLGRHWAPHPSMAEGVSHRGSCCRVVLQ